MKPAIFLAMEKELYREHWSWFEDSFIGGIRMLIPLDFVHVNRRDGGGGEAVHMAASSHH